MWATKATIKIASYGAIKLKTKYKQCIYKFVSYSSVFKTILGNLIKVKEILDKKGDELDHVKDNVFYRRLMRCSPCWSSIFEANERIILFKCWVIHATTHWMLLVLMNDQNDCIVFLPWKHLSNIFDEHHFYFMNESLRSCMESIIWILSIWMSRLILQTRNNFRQHEKFAWIDHSS